MTTAATYEMTTVTTSAGDVAVHDSGSGEAIVLLHGGGPGASALSNFEHNIPFLAKQFRVLAIDQPGYGGTHRPTLEQIESGLLGHNARVLVETLDRLGVERAHLVGNSQGGATALKTALEFPDRVGKLVLMGPAFAGVAPVTVEPTEGMREMVTFFLPPGPSADRLRRLIGLMVHDQSRITDDLVAERLAAATEPSHVEFYNNLGIAFMRGGGFEPLWPRIHEISHPALVVWGRDDRVLPLEHGLFIQKRMPDAQLHVFPNCGHWVQVERAREFERLVADFITAA